VHYCKKLLLLLLGGLEESQMDKTSKTLENLWMSLNIVDQIHTLSLSLSLSQSWGEEKTSRKKPPKNPTLAKTKKLKNPNKHAHTNTVSHTRKLHLRWCTKQHKQIPWRANRWSKALHSTALNTWISQNHKARLKLEILSFKDQRLKLDDGACYLYRSCNPIITI